MGRGAEGAVDSAESRETQQVILKGGLTIGAGVITGNITGFVRVALTAYLLGTHSRADSLAVAIAPLDSLNQLLINSMVFAFVPMLTERQGAERTALFLKLNRLFVRCFALLMLAIIALAPVLVRVLAPGLDPEYYSTTVNLLRIVSLSTLAAGAAAVHVALLYTDRRFAPSAFYQASLNLFTIVCALSLWKAAGVYGFAIGYAVGAWVQFAVVYVSARRRLQLDNLPPCEIDWRRILLRPSTIMIYAGGIAANITFTRAWATHLGPGMAAALDYCMRGVSVPMALLVSPVSNALLPEIARLRSQFRLREAFRLIDKTIALAALAVVAGAGVALTFRRPVIALMFERGSFTAESTLLVSAVFLGMGSSLIGWSLLELTSRSLFALERRKLPMVAAVIPVVCNVAITLVMHSEQPQFLGVGASIGLLVGFLFLWVLARARRKYWLGAA